MQIDRSTVANLIRLLELPADVKQMVQEGDISQGHARALLPLGDERGADCSSPRGSRRKACRSARPSRRVQDRIHALDGDTLRIVDAEGNSRPVARPRNEQIASLEQELRTALGTKVDLSQTAKGRGKITIHFKSHDEFARLRQILATSTASRTASGLSRQACDQLPLRTVLFVQPVSWLSCTLPNWPRVVRMSGDVPNGRRGVAQPG